MYLIDVETYNSHVLFKMSNPYHFEKDSSTKRRIYFENLALDVLKPQVFARYQNN